MGRLIKMFSVMVMILVFNLLFIGCENDSPTNSDYSVSITFVRSRPSFSTENSEGIWVLVTDMQGNPLPNKRVDWGIIQGDGTLYSYSSVTGDGKYDYGEANNSLYWTQPGEYKIKATVFGYNASVIFIITITKS